MPTVTLTAFDSVTANGYGNGPAFEWDTVAAGWGSSPNGDTGAHPQTGSVSPLFAIQDGLLTDDGTTIPAGATITSVTQTFTWTLTPASPAQLWFPGGTHIASPGASGSASEVVLTDATRADLYAQSFGWTVSTSGDGSPHNLRIQVSSFTVHVTYATVQTTITVDAAPVDFLPRVAPDVHIDDALDDAPTTAAFTVTTAPPGAAPIAITAFGVRLFTGAVQTIEEVYEGKPTQLAHPVTAIDRTWLLNRRRPFGAYVDTSASDIVSDLLATFAPDFSDAFVQTSLLPITIDFDGSDDFSACLSRIAATVGGCHFYIGNLEPPDLHFFYADPPATTFGPTGIAGPTTPLTVTEAGGSPVERMVFRVRYKYDDGRVSGWSPISAPVNLASLYDDLPIGPAVDGHLVVARQVFYQLLTSAYSTRWIPFFQIADNTTTTWDPADPEVPPFYWVDAIPSFRFAYGPNSVPTNPRPAGPGAVTPTVTGTNSGSTPYSVDTDMVFAMSCIYEDDTESLLGTVSAEVTQLTGTNKRTSFASIPIGASSGGIPVVYRKIYGAAGDAPASPTFDPLTSSVYGWLIIPDNTTTTIDDADRFAYGYPLAATLPAALHANGPDLEGGDDPDPIDDLNTSRYLLHDPPVRSRMDWSQIRTRVFVKGAGSALSTAEVAGTSALSVSDASVFAGQVGQILAGTRVLEFIGTSGSTILLAAVLPAPDLASGTPVSLWIERNDYAAQEDLAVTAGGDGVHESTVVDTTLTTLEAMAARGDAELLLFSRPILTVTYATRDPLTKAGKTIVIDLTDPPLAATLKIQAVAIDQVVVANTLTPRYTATASSVRFTLDDLLRRIV